MLSYEVDTEINKLTVCTYCFGNLVPLFKLVIVGNFLLLENSIPFLREKLYFFPNSVQNVLKSNESNICD